MTGTQRTIACLALAALLGACDDGASDPDDGGSTPRDAGDMPRDAGDMTRDAGDTPSDAGERDAGEPPAGSLSERYPGDVGIADDPAVLFHDDFESGWGRWDAPSSDTRYLVMESDASRARAGVGFLRSTVTAADLAETMYISSSARISHARVDEAYWRFYAQFVDTAPTPHHWVRYSAGSPSWESSGLANTVPAGDDGFWFDLDANTGGLFNFYVYWYGMRSGRCNDGSTTPGCAGDQGSTYHYGNVFRPADQTPIVRDRWMCIEVHARANAVGSSDGLLALWIDDTPVGEFRDGSPDGTWLRDQFHPGGCTFSACEAPTPFEGFDFRSSGDVGFKAFHLDAYYERDSRARRVADMEADGLTVSDASTILYDDIVIATERIGCARP